MATIERVYKCKDAEMVIAISVITENASVSAVKTFLISKKPIWADPFFPNLKTKIDLAVQTYLGADNAKALRLATQALLSIEANAFHDLANFKLGIEVDYVADKKRLKEILLQLGFTTYNTKAKQGNQESLIALLFQFKTNMTNTLQTELTTKGSSGTLITAIIAYANTLKAADVSQETFKGTRKTATAAAINEFNSCYTLAIGVCKIARKYYKDQADIKDQFSFSKVLKALSSNAKNEPAPPVAPQ